VDNSVDILRAQWGTPGDTVEESGRVCEKWISVQFVHMLKRIATPSLTSPNNDRPHIHRAYYFCSVDMKEKGTNR